MTTRAFWTAALERAIKTIAQTAVALIGAGAVNVLDIDFGEVAGVSGAAGLVSVLTSLASVPLSTGDSPSLVPAAEVKAAEG